jgi:hypothetical protein
MANKSTGPNLKDEQEEFENTFEIFRQQLLNASVNFYIWEQLFPTEKVVDIINQYIGFFQPTREAHLDGLIIKVSEILSNGRNAASLYRILNMIGRNPNLAPSINVREIKKRLRNHRKVVEAIKDYRNRRVAHWDTASVKERVVPEYAGIKRLGKPVFFGETKEMLTELQAIYNEISASHSKEIHAFRYGQQGDTISLLEALKKKRAEDKKLIEYWQDKMNHENEGLNCHE